MGTHEARNKQVVERYWDAHFRREWASMARRFAIVALGSSGAAVLLAVVALLTG